MKRSEQFLDSFEEIREEWIEDANGAGKTAPLWVKALSAVAIICLMIATFAILLSPKSDTSGDALASADEPSVPEESVPEITAASEAEVTDSYSNLPAYHTDGKQINYENTNWDMVLSELISAQDLDTNLWEYNDSGKPILTLTSPRASQPEILSMTYTFEYKMPELINSLAMIEAFYDPTQVSFEKLVEVRTSELGEPSSFDESKAVWSMGNTELMLLAQKDSIRERLSLNYLRYDESLLPEADLDALIADIQPPNGHYGWTLDEHIAAGLLNMDNGELEQGEEDVFVTPIELGGYELNAEYVFYETLAGRGSGRKVLAEVHIYPPEDIPLEQWVDSISEPWRNRMLRRFDAEDWYCPIQVGALLTPEQREKIAQAIVDDGIVAVTLEDAYRYLDSWNIAMNFYYNGRFWFYNGTGAALYSVANSIKP